MNRKICFSLPADCVAHATGGLLLGEFNNWNPDQATPLVLQEDGSLSASIDLEEGKSFAYRYLLNDGRWTNDGNEKITVDFFGIPVENSIIHVPKLEERKIVEPKKAVTKKSAVQKKGPIPNDDLTRIEGIGKKIAVLLQKEGIVSYKALAKCSVKKLQRMLEDAGSKFQMHDPTTWPKQAKLAASGDWEALANLQVTLLGGK